MTKLTCFKAYDIRGRLGEELNEDIAWRIGRAYGEYLKPKTIVLGGDVRRPTTFAAGWAKSSMKISRGGLAAPTANI
ncbi:hypothetical protein [Salmonella enterica]|uniref:hypothetical protein n=1 Tax=Salmonella enterica TaxID=28901 RepID=UPI0003A4B2B1